MTQIIHLTAVIPEELEGMRLDQALAKLYPDYSRTQIQEWIKKKEIKLDGKHPKRRVIVIGGETIEIQAALKAQPDWEAQQINLNIVYEDDALLIINKPVGMVVHPGAGNTSNTLLNALLHHATELKDLPRAGIIHRLDKDTSGLLVIAKTPAAFTHLTAQLKDRTVVRIYQSVVSGVLTSGGKVEAPIGRHPLQRKRMAVIETGKPAVTHYRVLERYRAHTRVKVQLETGRTHQIRVHMAHIHHPLLGDPVYAGRLQLPKGATPPLVDMLRQFKHQALHAYELTLEHPVTHEIMTWQAPIPEDMQKLIECLRKDTESVDKNDYPY
ncbi:MAG: 23S rRNA pseudouridine(1911/1915/1917) synthase RluD [Gammaproteobacteria bacterium]|nr:23S rRNA pseudouridine(1911/1915/1917) synthase RluD [Gammaproteobacteria bacterium]